MDSPLALYLPSQFDKDGWLEDLEEAIRLGSSAVGLRPLGPPEPHDSVNNFEKYFKAIMRHKKSKGRKLTDSKSSFPARYSMETDQHWRHQRSGVTAHKPGPVRSGERMQGDGRQESSRVSRWATAATTNEMWTEETVTA